MPNLNRPSIRSGPVTGRDLKARQRERSDTQSTASILLAAIIGVLGTLALIHWATVDNIIGASAAVAMPLDWLRRLRDRLRLAYLRAQLHWTDQELDAFTHELHHYLPRQIVAHRKHAEALQYEIARLEVRATLGDIEVQS